MNSDDTRLVNDEPNEEKRNKKQNDTARTVGTVTGSAAVGVAAGASAHAAFATSPVQADEDLDLEAIDLADGAAAGVAQHTQPAPQAARPQQPAQPAEPTQPEVVEPVADDNVNQNNPTDPNNQGGNATKPEEPVTPEDINEGNVTDEILAVEEIDENDLAGEEIFNFDEIGTVYTVDGEEFTAASFHLDNGMEGVMVDVDGDGVFDELAAQTSEGLVNLGEAPALTVDDVELELNPGETYMAQNDDVDHTLTDDSYMDDVLDTTLV